MNVILLGPPGAGKGTQGQILAERTKTPRIATGELLRAAVKDGTPLGRKARTSMDRGFLVPDEVILLLIEEVLSSPEAQNGVIMDGFPRTIAQAERVDDLLKARGTEVHKVLTLQVDDAELVSRLLGRATQEGRSDDTPEAIRQRLGIYQEQTAPLIDFYRARGIVVEVDGDGSIQDIADRVWQALHP